MVSLIVINIAPGTDLLAVWCQAITWTNADLLSIGPSVTNFIEISILIQNIHLEMLSTK